MEKPTSKKPLKEHRMTLYHSEFFGIKNGTQKIECRLNDPKRQEVDLGELITFTKLPEKDEFVNVRVVGLSRFASFEDMFSCIEPTRFGYPEDITVQEQTERMLKYYSEEKQHEHGVLGIHVELVNE